MSRHLIMPAIDNPRWKSRMNISGKTTYFLKWLKKCCKMWQCFQKLPSDFFGDETIDNPLNIKLDFIGEIKKDPLILWWNGEIGDKMENTNVWSERYIFSCQFQMREQIMFAATNPIYRAASASDLVGEQALIEQRGGEGEPTFPFHITCTNCKIFKELTAFLFLVLGRCGYGLPHQIQKLKSTFISDDLGFF